MHQFDIVLLPAELSSPGKCRNLREKSCGCQAVQIARIKCFIGVSWWVNNLLLLIWLNKNNQPGSDWRILADNYTNENHWGDTSKFQVWWNIQNKYIIELETKLHRDRKGWVVWLASMDSYVSYDLCTIPVSQFHINLGVRSLLIEYSVLILIVS